MKSASHPHYIGDVARVLRENLSVVRCPVALVTVTGPGLDVLPDAAARTAWNLGASSEWRRFRNRLKVEMWHRHGEPPPRVVAWAAQRQGRGVDHLHLVMLAGNEDQRRRIREWIVIYRELHTTYAFGFVDDPFHVRRSRVTGREQNLVFETAGKAGHYLGGYLGGGQLERFLSAGDRSWRPYWISPVLMARSGWSLRTCKWVRQAHWMRSGAWRGRTWYGQPLYPAWWHNGSQRAWVCAVTGWDGSPTPNLLTAV